MSDSNSKTHKIKNKCSLKQKTEREPTHEHTQLQDLNDTEIRLNLDKIVSKIPNRGLVYIQPDTGARIISQLILLALPCPSQHLH